MSFILKTRAVSKTSAQRADETPTPPKRSPESDAILRRLMTGRGLFAKADVQAPGSRGGNFHYSRNHKVRYGVPVPYRLPMRGEDVDLKEVSRANKYVGILRHQALARILHHGEHGLVKHETARGDRRHFLVTPNIDPDTRKEHPWRATKFDEHGVYGHETGPTATHALERALEGHDLDEIQAGTVKEFEEQQSGEKAKYGNRRAVALKRANDLRRQVKHPDHHGKLMEANAAIASGDLDAADKHLDELSTTLAGKQGLMRKALTWLAKARGYHNAPGQMSLFDSHHVKQPGIRGGHWRMTPQGDIRYDAAPADAGHPVAGRDLAHNQATSVGSTPAPAIPAGAQAITGNVPPDRKVLKQYRDSTGTMEARVYAGAPGFWNVVLHDLEANENLPTVYSFQTPERAVAEAKKLVRHKDIEVPTTMNQERELQTRIANLKALLADDEERVARYEAEGRTQEAREAKGLRSLNQQLLEEAQAALDLGRDRWARDAEVDKLSDEALQAEFTALQRHFLNDKRPWMQDPTAWQEKADRQGAIRRVAYWRGLALDETVPPEPPKGTRKQIEARVARLRREANHHARRSHNMIADRPPGQPVHTRAERNLLDNAGRAMDRSIAATKEAERLEAHLATMPRLWDDYTLPNLDTLYQLAKEVKHNAREARRLFEERYPGAMQHHEGERRWRGMQQWLDPWQFDDPSENYVKNGTRAAAFKEWFGDWERDPAGASKVVDANGEPEKQHPLKVYHGSPKEFTEFDPMLADSGALYGPGFYFTENADVAAGYQTKEIVGIRDDGQLKALARFVRKYLPPGFELKRSASKLWNIGTGGHRLMVSYRLIRDESAPGGWETWPAFGSDDMSGRVASLDNIPEKLGWDAGTTALWKRTAPTLGWPTPTGKVGQYYLNIRRPFDADKDTIRASEMSEDMRQHVALNAKEWERRNPDFKWLKAYKSDEPLSWNDLATVAFSKRLATEAVQSAGYDGLTHIGGILSGGKQHRVWIAFKPTQIKSVHNVGTFKPEDPNVLKARMCGGRLILKTHVKQYTRTSKTGAPVVVQEHEDKRMAARARMPSQRARSNVVLKPQPRHATIHTAGPQSPGTTVRMLPHPSRPGAWQVHPKDKERAKAALAPPEQQRAKDVDQRAKARQQAHEWARIFQRREVFNQPSSAYKPADPSGKDTEGKFKLPNGEWTPQRQALHKAIIDHFAANLTPSTAPVFYMMGGGPASGKGHVQGMGVMNLPDARVQIDADEIKKLLPEYKEMNKAKDAGAATYVHEESSYVSGLLIKHAAEQRFAAMFDSVGDSSIDKLAKKVKAMRAGGHKVVAHYVTTDIPTALKRALERGQKTGRYVPESFIREAHRNVSQIFPEAAKAGLFDEAALWDTTQEGQAPVKVCSVLGTKLTVHDKKLWNAFLAKAEQEQKAA